MWVVHATEAPAHNLLKMAHGDVVVTKHKQSEKPDRENVPPPVASPATLAWCGQKSTDHAGSRDPWQSGSDPWQKPMVVDQAPPTATLQKLEEQLEQNVKARMPDVTQTCDRIQNLEAQMQAMFHKHSALETHVREADARQQQQMTSVQAQLHQHSLQYQQIHGAIEGQQQTMAAMFDSQMSQIRGMLQKRPREEGSMEPPESPME